MPSPHQAVVELIREYPELEDTVEELVALDKDGPWAFEDVSCDSGRFGEIVSREFVESVEGGYRLVDREAAHAALESEPAEREDSAEEDETATQSGDDGQTQSVAAGLRERLPAASDLVSSYSVLLFVTLVFLFIMRSITFRTVFREKFVVFPGNDPYHYRHHVDRLLDAQIGLLDFSAAASVLGDRVVGEPFTYILGWMATRVIAGSPETSGFVLAWLPVLATVVIGVTIAWMAHVLTEDERIPVLTLLAFALTPAHALYSSLGFFDHSALDFVWLTLMAATLLYLADAVEQHGVSEHLRKGRTWFAATGFGLACAIAMLSWNGSPLLLLGLVLYAVVRPASAVRTENSPLKTGVPICAGLGIATGITHLFHTTYGFQEPAVVYTPAIVLVGVAGVASFSEGIVRADGEPWWVLGSAVGVGSCGLAGTWLVAPDIFERLRFRFLSALLGRDSAVETQSLFAPDIGLTFNPLQHFGLLLLFALPALGLVTWKCIQRHRPRWLLLASYGWATFGLAIIQVRFAAEFSPFSSILAAVGVIWALSRLGLCQSLSCFERAGPVRLHVREWIQDVNRAVYLSFAVVVFAAVGIFFTVAITGTVMITDQQYDAAAWLSEQEDDGQVLSHWGRNRMYNYFYTQEADNYSFAQNNLVPFLKSEDPDEWYGWLAEPHSQQVLYYDYNGNPVTRFKTPNGTTSSRNFGEIDYVLFDEKQIGQEFPYQAWINAVGHFQLAYVSEFDRISVFRSVEGAVVTGEALPGSTVDVTTDIEVNGYEYTYTREAAVDQNGEFAVRVAYPGTYTVGNRTVEVSSTDVNEGGSVSVLDEK